MIVCKNCKVKFKGNFCSNCGQSADTHPINFRFIWHDIQYGLLHINKGIFYTIKEMFTRPGYTIKDFIDGKRINHFKPISFVIVLATIYGFLYHFFHINMISSFAGDVPKNLINLEKINEWRASHYSIIELIYLPVFSFSSWLIFKKNHLNFTEHFVLNAFITGQILIVYLISLPLFIIYNGTPTLNVFTTIFLLIKILLVWWGYSQFFKPTRQVKIFFKTILTFICFFILWCTLFAFFFINI